MPRTLPARYYVDPQLFSKELEAFYFERWICAGRADQIPKYGDYFLRDVGNESVIVVRAQDRSIRAFYNVCRHRGTRLCEEGQGSFERKIQCPYHGWSYAFDGRLLGAPHMEPGFEREDFPLNSVACDLWDGHVFLNFSKKPKPLLKQLGALPEKFAAWNMESLRLGKRIVYDVHANWKLIVSNYNECLHCPTVHPDLNRLTDYLGADNENPRPEYIGGAMGFKKGMETMSFTGARPRPFLPGLDPKQRSQVYYYAIYPNLLLSLNPDYMMTHLLWPRAVNRTEIVCEFHFPPGETKMEDALEFWDKVNREDWRISELSQAGIGSRSYTPGPYSPREHLLWAFDQLVVAENNGTKERRARKKVRGSK